MVALHVRSIFRDYLPAYRLKTRQNTREVPRLCAKESSTCTCQSCLYLHEAPP